MATTVDCTRESELPLDAKPCDESPQNDDKNAETGDVYQEKTDGIIMEEGAAWGGGKVGEEAAGRPEQPEQEQQEEEAQEQEEEEEKEEEAYEYQYQPYQGKPKQKKGQDTSLSDRGRKLKGMPDEDSPGSRPESRDKRAKMRKGRNRSWGPSKCFGGATNDADRLIEVQLEELPSILQELEINQRKVHCWIWWVFPTEMPGMCDPKNTSIKKSNAHKLFGEGSAEDDWRKVVEKICDLLDARGMTVLPRIDHGRIHHFLKMWQVVPNKPDWMEEALVRLEKFDWPPR
mmetsp:Transcript_79781/g.165787  ORF Transcript_79781/g.165787 Transcript_79781/m.165787 type:complete len:288 (-) Transcript_79781:84-947(-)